MSSADVVAREAAWLNTTSDTLPSLPKNAGGPFDVIAAYTQGAQTRTQARAIYVTRGQVQPWISSSLTSTANSSPRKVQRECCSASAGRSSG